jgi:hypothetical protein
MTAVAFVFGARTHTHTQVIVQNYNLLFTLGHLAQLSDGVLAIENDQMGAVCREVQNIICYTCVHIHIYTEACVLTRICTLEHVCWNVGVVICKLEREYCNHGHCCAASVQEQHLLLSSALSQHSHMHVLTYVHGPVH